MANEKAIAALSKKLDSVEKFEQALLEGGIVNYPADQYKCNCAYGAKYAVLNANQQAYRTSDFNYNGADPAEMWRSPDLWRGTTHSSFPVSLWWLLRERLRMMFGVYPAASEMLGHLNTLNATVAFAVHISVADPTKIAYTPSAADGEADRQLSTTIGKFLKKHVITMTDEEVQAVDAAHRADMSREIEIITGAAAIKEVYTNMVGDSGCMRYSSSHFNLPADYHPSMVYDAPGVGVAVLRNGSGEVKARTVVYTNPNDPSDKRYVRLYGDGMLKKRLERAGYQCKTLLGVTLRAVPSPRHTSTDDKTVIVGPYIDGAGGNSGYDGRYGVLTDAGLTMVSQADAEEIQRAHGSHAAVYMTGASGVYTFKKVPTNWFCGVSDLTGKEYDTRTATVVKVLLPDMSIGKATIEEVAGTFSEVRAYNLDCRSRAETLYALSNTPRFSLHGSEYLDIPAQREGLGFAKLDVNFYPDNQEWVYRSSDYYVLTNSSTLIRREDSVLLISDGVDGLRRDRVHKSAVPATATQVWGMDNTRVFAAEGVTVHVTPSKRKVVAGIHDIAKAYNGVWDFTRNLKNVRVMDHGIQVPRAMEVTDIDVMQVETIANTVADYAARTNRDYANNLLRALLTRTHSACYWNAESQAWFGQYATSSAVAANDMANVLATEAKLLTMTDDEITAAADATSYMTPAHMKWTIKSNAAIVRMYQEKAAAVDAERVQAAADASGDITNVDALVTSSRFSTARFSLAA